MAKKEILTNEKIEKDIITALKNPPHDSEDSHNKTKIIIIIMMLCLIALSIWLGTEIFAKLLTASCLAVVFFLIVYAIFYSVRFKIKIKKISINDYSLTTEIVHSTAHEHYVIRGSKHTRSQHIDNYILRFENGKTWRISKDNYLWSVERPMSDLAIYESTHREDTMIVVTQKDSGDIVMAYHTDFFEYKN